MKSTEVTKNHEGGTSTSDVERPRALGLVKISWHLIGVPWGEVRASSLLLPAVFEYLTTGGVSYPRTDFLSSPASCVAGGRILLRSGTHLCSEQWDDLDFFTLEKEEEGGSDFLPGSPGQLTWCHEACWPAGTLPPGSGPCRANPMTAWHCPGPCCAGMF